MENNENIIDSLYGNINNMTQSDQKIAQVILQNPAVIVNYTISELAVEAKVSEASVSRFCKNLSLAGFHQLKIALARVASNETSYYKDVDFDDLQNSLENIKDNKIAEITSTLANFSTSSIKRALRMIEKARVLQVSAVGNTFPVAADAAYRFNQLGVLTICAESWQTAIAQTLNLKTADVLLVISNSGESRVLLKQIAAAHQNGLKVLALTNRPDSPIALEADLHLTTAVRQKVLQSEYYFSRIAAMTAIEAIFLLLLAKDKKRLGKVTQHEKLISDEKV
ncbi:MurR/RpiR family transcriptional regulator [Liquorilactobacillus oeni]|uniref:RpiR family transcriptional regulator n=1 Tax=Liquorilactobacillus oeni DSM 19972 TaxID=1423777 RepID=A0A0R1MAI6_9LACO|nr:MurR/RpiR family transcriptional regulator [Liquorilactobacillus oeni]KRL05100.1 RpiR family transcriptional regulator [Liquorilactobacillus oeni DSM 19972]